MVKGERSTYTQPTTEDISVVVFEAYNRCAFGSTVRWRLQCPKMTIAVNIKYWGTEIRTQWTQGRGDHAPRPRR